MGGMLWLLAAMLFGLRLLVLRRFWRLPVSLGPDRLFTARLDPGSESFRLMGLPILRRSPA